MPIDYKKYPANWKTEIRPAILERASNKCEQCNVPNKSIVCRGEWYGTNVWQNDDGQMYCADTGKYIGDTYVGDVWTECKQSMVKIVLTIAHLDHDVTNNDYSNLKALCQRCHLKHDAQHHKANSRATRERKMKMDKLF